LIERKSAPSADREGLGYGLSWELNLVEFLVDFQEENVVFLELESGDALAE